MFQLGKEGFEPFKVLERILEDWGEGVLYVCACPSSSQGPAIPVSSRNGVDGSDA